MRSAEAFAISAKHLLKQNKRSLIGAECAYRGSCGAMCAIGVLIPDKEYRPRFEGLQARVIALEVPSLQSVNKWLLARLQKIHDKLEPHEWRSELCKVADDFGFDKGFLEDEGSQS